MNRVNQVFADMIIEQLVAVQPQEKVLIEITDQDNGLAAELIRAVYQAGGVPFYHHQRDRLQCAWLQKASVDAIALQASWDAMRMREMDAFISLRSSTNPFDLQDIPASQSNLFRMHHTKPVHFDIRIPHTRWLAMSLPNASMAQAAGMSTEAFETFYYRCCCIDYRQFAKRMQPLAERMARTDRVRIVGKDVNLHFSIRDIGVSVCRGNRNIPAGEVFTAPVLDSVEGWIRYNTPAVQDGHSFSGITLQFSKGIIQSVSCDQGDPAVLETIFSTDAGSRHIGEFAMGTNPFVDHSIGNIMFDEKAAGSFHFTPGNSYSGSGNGNISRIHWDLIYKMQPQYGGGEIWFDDTLIQRDGLYIPDDLQPLNPDSLKQEITLLP